MNTSNHRQCDAGKLSTDMTQKICRVQALCVHKEYGPKGQTTDFCSCEYSRLLLKDNDDGTCRLTPNSYIMFCVLTIVAVITLFYGLWGFYMLHAARRSRALRINSLFSSVLCTAVAALIVTITVGSRALFMVSTDQKFSDLLEAAFNISRLCSPVLLFGTLTTVGNSIHIITLQTLQVPMNEEMDRKRKFALVAVVLLFAGVVIPLVAVNSYQLSSGIISVLSVVCWWPFKRLGRRLRTGFPIAHLPAAFRERSFAVSEHLRIATNQILMVLYLRVIAGVFLVTSFILRTKIYSAGLGQFEAFSDCFNAVTAVALLKVFTSGLTVMVRVRLESAMHLKAIAMLVSNSPRTEPASITILSEGSVFDKEREKLRI
jgi:hypothetical protein